MPASSETDDNSDEDAERPSDGVIERVLLASKALVLLSARSSADSPGLTLPRFGMLVTLDMGAMKPGGLAGAPDVAPSTAMRMVDRLVETGL